MSETNKYERDFGGEAAFPSTTHTADGHTVNGPNWGVTKREYFAIKILAGLVADTNFDVKAATAAQVAVEFADALISELKKGGA
jgi:hypothetical protein